MPLVEGLQLHYSLHPLPPGGFGFRRWRWELYHGATLIATGWRVARPDAEQALRKYAARFGHQLFGLRGAPSAALTPTGEEFRPGATVRVDAGPVTCWLVPRAVADDRSAAALR